MRRFEYVAPQSLEEAVQALAQRPGARALAGGTDIIVQMKEAATRFPFPSCLVSLDRIAELKEISFDDSEGLRIGAGATMADIAQSAVIRERFRGIAEGAGIVGSVQTMNMATLGGNLCNAAPSADTAPPLLAHEAQAVIVGPSGRRTLTLEEFFRSPGLTALAGDELLAEVRVPSPSPNTGSAYTRHTPRKQMDIAVVGVAAVLTLDGETSRTARIALGAVAPTPIRVRVPEAVLEGQPLSDEVLARAAEAAAGAARPISDTRGSAEFRTHLVRVITERMLAEAARRAESG